MFVAVVAANTCLSVLPIGTVNCVCNMVPNEASNPLLTCGAVVNRRTLASSFGSVFRGKIGLDATGLPVCKDDAGIILPPVLNKVHIFYFKQNFW